MLSLLLFPVAARGGKPSYVNVVDPTGRVLRAHESVQFDAGVPYVALGNGFRLYAGADGQLGTADDVVRGFGRFPQQGTANDVSDPLDWRLLDIQGDHAILVTSVIIDSAPFDSSDTSSAWDTSTLRAWLNSKGGKDEAGDSAGFLDRAFSPQEKAKLIESEVGQGSSTTFIAYNRLRTSDWWQPYSTLGPSTRDLVWVLSGEEVFRYFGHSLIATRSELGHDPANYSNAYFVPSPWAHAHGVKINEGRNGKSFTGFGDAWTRSSGAPYDGQHHYGVFLGSTGSLNVGRPVSSSYGVLPVVAVRLVPDARASGR